MDGPDTFLTLDTLRTLAGQVLVVGMITQAVKASVPWLATYWIRLVAIGAGIGLHVALVWTAGMGPGAYALALANGTLVAMAAMKAAELLKGEAAG